MKHKISWFRRFRIREKHVMNSLIDIEKKQKEEDENQANHTNHNHVQHPGKTQDFFLIWLRLLELIRLSHFENDLYLK